MNEQESSNMLAYIAFRFIEKSSSMSSSTVTDDFYFKMKDFNKVGKS